MDTKFSLTINTIIFISTIFLTGGKNMSYEENLNYSFMYIKQEANKADDPVQFIINKRDSLSDSGRDLELKLMINQLLEMVAIQTA